MEALLVLIGLFFLASPVIAIVALVTANNLKDELAQLRRELGLFKASMKDTAQAPVRKAAQRAKPPVKTQTVEAALAPAASKPKTTQPAPKPIPVVRKEVKNTNPVKPNGPRRKPASPPKPRASLEEVIGSQWSVWVGGIALAIGAVFMIKFSIESGVFSPAIRLGLAAVMGALALGGGEWLRRRDDQLTHGPKDDDIPFFQQAYIPGVLTAVGVFTWLGVIYAAHAIYGFIGPAPAFLLLGLTSLLGLGLGLLHGPKMAAMGLVAALITPLLVESAAPNFLALFGYLGLIGAAALALADKRKWSVLSVLTLFGLLIWMFITQAALKEQVTMIMWLAFAGFIYGASLWTVLRQESVIPDDVTKWPGFDVSKFDRRLSAFWTGLLGGIAILIYNIIGVTNLPLIAALSLAALFIGAGAWQRRFNVHILIGGGMAAILAVWSELGINISMALAALSGLALWALCFRESRTVQSKSLAPNFIAPIWTVISAGAPVLIWAVLSQEKGGYDTVKTAWFDVNSLGYFEGGVYIVMAFILGAAADYLWRRADQADPKSLAVNIYAAAGGLALVFGLLFTLNMDVKFYAALIAAVIAGGIYHLRPVWALRPMMAGALLLAALFAVGHHIQGGDIGRRYIANGLWIFLALTAVISFALAKRLSLKEEDIWSEGLKALALSLAALFAVMQIHHLMNNGHVLATSFSLEETALVILTGLCFTFGSAWMERDVKTPIMSRPLHKRLLPSLSIGFSVATLLLFGLSVIFAMNPLLNDDINVKGLWVLNTLFLAYFLPAVLLGAIAMWSRHSRPPLYVRTLAGLGLLSFMIYVTASMRNLFSVNNINLFENPPGGLELYAISAAWLVVGISLLALGLKTRRQDVRIVSGLIIILTVLKAFLIDMAGLEGVLRAMSFVILGLVLIVIGRVYQSLIFKDYAAGRPAVNSAKETEAKTS